MLTIIRKLIETLNTTGIRYCHWKSNLLLSEALSGQTDVDLLIDRRDADSFRTVMGQLRFRPALVRAGASFPSVEHSFALDEETGILVHVHAYFRVITGESLAKNYHLPIEEMLLQNTREEDSVRLPVKAAESVVFAIRMMLKHTSLVELVLLMRDWGQVRREVEWLLEAGPLGESVRLIESWLPSLNTDLFSECVAALKLPAPLTHRIILGLRLRSELRLYSRHSPVWAWFTGVQKLSIMIYRRLTRSREGMFPQTGGAVIAFVGPEATGKSTLIAEMKHWLGEHFELGQIHAGKPRSTLLTAIPNLLVPALRQILPTYRSGQIETQYVTNDEAQKSPKVYPLLFAIRSVLLGYDRRALLARAFAQAANGSIILCDRYPSVSSGAVDSPQLQQFPIPRDRYPVRHLLARIEKRLYQEIPPPDLVVSLSVPVEVALMRNKSRGKEEPEEYVRLRHARSSEADFGNTAVCKIVTDQPLEQTVREVKNAIWRVL